MSPLRRMGKNLVFKMLTEFVGRVLSFVFYIVLARWLGEEPFGVFSLLYSVTAIVVFLVDPGLNISLIRDAPRKAGHLEKVAGAILWLKLSLSALVVAVVTVYGYAAGYEGRVVFLLSLMGAQMSAYALMEYASAIFQAKEQMHVETYLMSVGKLGVTLIAIGVVAAGGGLTETIIAMTLAQAGAALWALSWTSRRGVPLKPRLDGARLAGLLKDSVPLAAVTFFTIAYYRIDVAIAPFLGMSLKDIGYYSAGVKILDVWLAAPTLAVAAAFPTLSKMAGDSRPRFIKLMSLLIVALGVGGIVAGAVTVIFSGEIISVIFGERFAPAAAPMMWLGGAVIFMYLRHGLIQGHILDGGHRAAVWLTMAAAPLNIALVAALVSLWGIMGMAAAKLLTDAAVVAGAGWLWVVKHYRKKDDNGKQTADS